MVFIFLAYFTLYKREVGGGIRMGKTSEPKAISFQSMKKFTTNKKKIKLNLKKINKIK